MNETDSAYYELLKELFKHGEEVVSRGMKHKELRFKMLILEPRHKLITVPYFETNEKYAKEELRWYHAATNRIDFSDVIYKTWKRFSDDGKTVNSAYGHRIFGEHKSFCDQWSWCLHELLQDSGTRRAIININYCGDKRKKTKDFPCTMYLQFFIRDNKLDLLCSMRSQDLYYGTRNDVFCFMSLQESMTKLLDIELGKYYHFMASAHLYEAQYVKLDKLFQVCCEACGKKEKLKQTFLDEKYIVICHKCYDKLYKKS